MKPITSTLPTPSPACLLSHCCTTTGLFQVSNHELQIRTSPSERKTKQGVWGRRNKKGCLWRSLSTQSCRGADGIKTCPFKMQTLKSFASGGHTHTHTLGNTVQQQMEWKEEAKVISSQSNARKEETQALKVSTVLLRGLPKQESWPTAFSLFAERTLLLG